MNIRYITLHSTTWPVFTEDKRRKCWQLGQSNGSVTDGPVECDNRPSTAGQWNGQSFQEFAIGNIGNDWAETLNLAMRHGWAATNRVPLGMDWPTFAGLWHPSTAPINLLTVCQ